jgi:hypothetical protein
MKPKEMFTKINQKFSSEFSPEDQPLTTTARASTPTATPDAKPSLDKIYFMNVHQTGPAWKRNYGQHLVSKKNNFMF